MTRDDFLQPLLNGADASLFDDWEVVPGYIDGEHAATAVLKGTEIHFCIVPFITFSSSRAASCAQNSGASMMISSWMKATGRLKYRSLDGSA